MTWPIWECRAIVWELDELRYTRKHKGWKVCKRRQGICWGERYQYTWNAPIWCWRQISLTRASTRETVRLWWDSRERWNCQQRLVSDHSRQVQTRGMCQFGDGVRFHLQEELQPRNGGNVTRFMSAGTVSSALYLAIEGDHYIVYRLIIESPLSSSTLIFSVETFGKTDGRIMDQSNFNCKHHRRSTHWSGSHRRVALFTFKPYRRAALCTRHHSRTNLILSAVILL